MVENVINSFLEDYINQIKDTLVQNKINSSGNLSNSFVIRDLNIYSADYLEQALEGIKPNTYSVGELIPRIKEWTQYKGVPNNLVGAISQVIAKRGSRRFRKNDIVELPLFDVNKLEQKIKDDIYSR